MTIRRGRMLLPGGALLLGGVVVAMMMAFGQPRAEGEGLPLSREELGLAYGGQAFCCLGEDVDPNIIECQGSDLGCPECDDGTCANVAEHTQALSYDCDLTPDVDPLGSCSERYTVDCWRVVECDEDELVPDERCMTGGDPFYQICTDGEGQSCQKCKTEKVNPWIPQGTEFCNTFA